MQFIYKYCFFLIAVFLSTSCEKNKLPTCKITSPSEESEFYLGETIMISVDAGDPDGHVTEVRFYVNNVVVKLLRVPPYAYEWNTENEEDGFHLIKAMVKDDNEAASEDEVIISVNTYRTFTDSRDDNTYKSLKIGDQIWMAENLAYLPAVSPPEPESYSDPYYYVFDFHGTNVIEAQATDYYKTYGVLYNFPAAINACPAGWHLPSDEEWKDLETTLGMSKTEVDLSGGSRGTNEGSKLAGNADLWTDGYLELNAEFGTSGFTALPGGLRNQGGRFDYMGSLAYFWSATEEDSSSAWDRSLSSGMSIVGRKHSNKENAFSVRCVKD